MSYEEPLNNENVFRYALRHYDNPSCRTLEEFKEDLARVTHVKRLLLRRFRNGFFEEHHLNLCLNHIIVLQNVFGNRASVRILFLKTPEKVWKYLIPFLLKLSYCGKSLSRFEVGEKIVNIETLETCKELEERLRRL